MDSTARSGFYVFMALCAADALTPSTAFAYVDPLAGSLFLQALIAGALGAVLAFKRVGFGLKSIFHRMWRRFSR